MKEKDEVLLIYIDVMKLTSVSPQSLRNTLLAANNGPYSLFTIHLLSVLLSKKAQRFTVLGS